MRCPALLQLREGGSERRRAVTVAIRVCILERTVCHGIFIASFMVLRRQLFERTAGCGGKSWRRIPVRRPALSSYVLLQKSSKNLLRSRGKLLVSVARSARGVTVKNPEAVLR